MSSILITAGHRTSYPVVFDSVDTIAQVVSSALGRTPEQIVVVIDSNVSALYGEKVEQSLSQLCDPKTIIIPAGETSKSSETLSNLYDKILAMNIDRGTPVVAVGGGVVGDLAGFAAATVLRGLPLIHVPTTLTAQVDSSIGGKTGINHDRGKNLIGSFYPPVAILCDTSLLTSLPQHDWLSGLAEVVKHAYLDGESHYESLVSAWTDLIERRYADIDLLVRRSAGVKARIVQEDEKESGKRMWLNLGHTAGHAIERITNYTSFTHGEAVAIGLAVAIELSRMRSLDSAGDLAYQLIQHMEIADRVGALDPANVFSATSTDKKRRSNNVPFVLLKKIGAPYLDSKITSADFLEGWAQMLSRIQD